MPSPLFKLASVAIRRQATQAYRRSTFGRLVNEVERTKRMGQRGPDHLKDVVKRYGKRFDPERMVKEAMGQDMRSLVRQVEVYSRSGGVSKRLLNGFLDALGPAGNLVRAIIKPGKGRNKGLAGELQRATQFLEAHGHVVIPPKGSPTVGRVGRGINGLVNWLESQGQRLEPEQEPKAKKESKFPFGISETTRKGTPRRYVDLPGPGKSTRLPANHPAVTGDFVKVDSSNVHSWAYDADNAYLYVRFLAAAAHGEPRTAPGPLYRYRDIGPEMAKALHDAPSKGSWIWDELRVRGTIAGYQKPYALVGVMGGYVPRQATLMAGGEEWFKRRQLHMGGGKWLTSSKPDQFVQFAGDPGGPNRGAPSRGQPNRGR